MSLRTSTRTPVHGRGRVVRRGARGGTSGWGIGSRVVPATAVPEELVNQVGYITGIFFFLCNKKAFFCCCCCAFYMKYYYSNYSENVKQIHRTC